MYRTIRIYQGTSHSLSLALERVESGEHLAQHTLGMLFMLFTVYTFLFFIQYANIPYLTVFCVIFNIMMMYVVKVEYMI